MQLLDRRRLRHLGRKSDLLKKRLQIRPGARVALVNCRPEYPLPEEVETAADEPADVNDLVGDLLMIVGGLAEIVLGVAAERRSLEEVAAPLTLVGGHGVPTPPHTTRRPAVG